MQRTILDNGTEVVIWAGRLKAITPEAALIAAGDERQSDWLVPFDRAAIGPIVSGVAVIVVPAQLYDAAIADEMAHLPAQGRA